MPILPIVTPPQKILRQKAQPVSAFTPELQTLIDDMVETMHAAPGVGLAAPQVGQGIRLFVAHLLYDPYHDPETDEPLPPGVGKVLVMINPQLSERSDEKLKGTEGCLSLPGILGEVMRHKSLTVDYLDRYGRKKKLRTYGWMARVIQHEYDHLDGILFVDKAVEVWEDEEVEGEVAE